MWHDISFSSFLFLSRGWRRLSTLLIEGVTEEDNLFSEPGIKYSHMTSL
jgi:hypothetical protein